MPRPTYNNLECITQIKRWRNVHHGRRKTYAEITWLLNDRREFASPAGIMGGWNSTSVKNILQRAARTPQRKRIRRQGVVGVYLSVTQATGLFEWCLKTLDIRFKEDFNTRRKPRYRRSMRAAKVTLAMLLTGVRRKELCGLRVKDMPAVHGKREIIVMGKRRTLRTVRITPFAEAFFNWVCGSRRSGYVFNSETGKRHQPQNINAILRGVGLKTNLTFLHPHLLRHTYASILIWNGCDIGFVRDQLGHANIATTNIYTNVITEQLSENPPQAVVDFLKAINPLDPENINRI